MRSLSHKLIYAFERLSDVTQFIFFRDIISHAENFYFTYKKTVSFKQEGWFCHSAPPSVLSLRTADFMKTLISSRKFAGFSESSCSHRVVSEISARELNFVFESKSRSSQPFFVITRFFPSSSMMTRHRLWKMRPSSCRWALPTFLECWNQWLRWKPEYGRFQNATSRSGKSPATMLTRALQILRWIFRQGREAWKNVSPDLRCLLLLPFLPARLWKISSVLIIQFQ